MHLQPLLILTLAVHVYGQLQTPPPGGVGFYLTACKDAAGTFNATTTEKACIAYGGDATFVPKDPTAVDGPVCLSISNNLEPKKVRLCFPTCSFFIIEEKGMGWERTDIFRLFNGWMGRDEDINKGLRGKGMC
ncbi:hypothetical protein HYFRA_00014125 [Hymenoscyphus fraxineus]|uniref:Cyanovirin-N domain-containing protein n=1 Tax=Hymenoscyphus fraxineus TaxID=746836 RepID=A0A9N9Q1R2_9HELO|nr:hypothetical protein HYFRA_00014125 [Hymenoscyphus fraxineus]